MNPRTRNVAHLWCDKQVVRWFRKNFNAIQYKNLQLVYFALCQIDSDFREHPIKGLAKTIQTYAGVSWKITVPVIYFLEELKLVHIEQQRKDNKFQSSILKMFEWDGQDEHYIENKNSLDKILSGEVKRTETSSSTLVDIDKSRCNKNTKVSINKNTINSNLKTLSKDKDNSSSSHSSKSVDSDKTTDVDKTLKYPKIKKKSSVDTATAASPATTKSDTTSSTLVPRDSDSFTRKKPVPKPKYDYSILDKQLYNELVECGATQHDQTKQSYFNTMNTIHEMLNTGMRNPYCASKNVPDDYKIKEWDFDEIVDTFKYYVSIADKVYYKNISSFLYSNGYGTKTWSPLVKFNIDMNNDNGDTLEGDEKKLMKGLHKMNITELDSKAVRRTLKLLNVHTSGYRVNQQLAHIYFGSHVLVLLSYVQTQMRNLKFKPVYMQGENFMKQFVSDSVNTSSLIKGNNTYTYI